ncbi:MAG TPA: MarR family transcriptional regulator [Propionibacteriaceae bacterium]|nr:MarR family transcriptional regulator [Propionibacteriaceae bacterium]
MSVAYTDRGANLLGALVLAVVDDLRPATADAAVVQLADHPDLTIEDLRRRTGLTHSATVRMVAQLEQRGLVTRGQSDRDRRAVVLTLTADGRDAATRVLAARAEVLAGVLAPLAPADRHEFERLLGLLLDALPRSADHATVICRLCELPACPMSHCPVEHSYLHHLGQ